MLRTPKAAPAGSPSPAVTVRPAPRRLRTLLCAALVPSALACASAPAPAPAPDVPDVHGYASFSRAPTVTRLTVLHASDAESELLATSRVRGGPEVGGLGRFVALVEALRRKAGAATVTFAAGDMMIPAPALQVELEGRNAVAVGNGLAGYHASVLGNHEFDLGESFLADIVKQSPFPWLSATLDFTAGPLDELDVEEAELAAGSPWLEDLPGRIVARGKRCVGTLPPAGATPRTCDGLVVGVIGATTELLKAISSVAPTTRVAPTLDDVRRIVQRHADALAAEGVTIVVLLSHLQGVERELELVKGGLTGVDLVLAGGGDDRLADGGDRLLPGDAPAPACGLAGPSCYPILRTARDGRPVLIAATDGELLYVGELGLRFDAAGVLTGFEPASHPWPVDDASLAALGAAVGGPAAELERRVAATIEPLSVPFARTALFLNGLRESVRNRETNLGNLVSDAMLWAGRQRAPGSLAAFAVRNGGGIRAAIGAIEPGGVSLGGGPLRPLDLQSSLRFDNELVLVRTTHAVLAETLESALIGAGTGRGRFPQVSGELRLEYTEDQPEQEQAMGADGRVTGVLRPGQRLRNLTLATAVGPLPIVRDGVVMSPDAEISFITISYLARGGDGWFPGRTGALSIMPLGLREQEALRSFVEAREREGRWNDGAGYPDPIPGRPETFGRILRLEPRTDPAR